MAESLETPWWKLALGAAGAALAGYVYGKMDTAKPRMPALVTIPDDGPEETARRYAGYVLEEGDDWDKWAKRMAEAALESHMLNAADIKLARSVKANAYELGLAKSKKLAKLILKVK